MTKSLYILYLHLSKSSKKYTFYFIFISLIYSFTEIITLGALLPLLMIVLNPEKFIDYVEKYGFSNFNVSQLQFYTILLFFVSVILSYLCKLYLINLNSKYSAKIGSEINKLSFENFIYSPYFEKKLLNSSFVISFFVNKVNEAIGQGWMSALSIFNNAVTLLLILLSLFLYSPIYTTIFFLSIALLYLLIMAATKKTTRNLSYEINHDHESLLKTLNESIGSSRSLHFEHTHERYINNFFYKDYKIRIGRGYLYFISLFPKSTIETLSILIILLFVFYSLNNNISPDSFLPLLALFLYSSQKILPIVQQIYSALSSIRGVESSIYSLIKWNLIRRSQIYPVTNSQHFSEFESLQFVNVSFNYNGNTILQNVNFKILKGDFIVISGKSGSGKSTLIDLLLGLLPPNQGKIIVNDVLLNHTNLDTWQSKISQVSQSIFLMDSSILENIVFGREGQIDISKLNLAVSASGLDEVIKSKNEGLAFLIGEGGSNLSGGQRQRLAIARALYQDRMILVMDEATSALDLISEIKVIQEIQKLYRNKILILISHNPEIHRIASRVLRVDSSNVKSI